MSPLRFCLLLRRLARRRVAGPCQSPSFLSTFFRRCVPPRTDLGKKRATATRNPQPATRNEQPATRSPRQLAVDLPHLFVDLRVFLAVGVDGADGVEDG